MAKKKGNHPNLLRKEKPCPKKKSERKITSSLMKKKEEGRRIMPLGPGKHEKKKTKKE